MMVARRAPGPAYANLQWRCYGAGVGEDIASVDVDVNRWSTPHAEVERPEPIPHASQTGWHADRRDRDEPFELARCRDCAWHRAPAVEEARCRRCKKGTYCTYYNLCVMCLTAAFVPHRPNKYFHVIASNGIVSSSPYTPLAIMTASPIASVRVFETVRDADLATFARDHHAERSSVLGSCFWPLIVIR